MILGQTRGTPLGLSFGPRVRLFPASFTGKNREGRREQRKEPRPSECRPGAGA